MFFFVLFGLSYSVFSVRVVGGFTRNFGSKYE